MMEEQEREILWCAMGIVNHTNESVGTSVEMRQDTNDSNFEFAVDSIKELLQSLQELRSNH